MKNDKIKDLVPELLTDITKDFDSKTKESKILKEKFIKLKNKKANHIDSNEFAQEIGEILSSAFKENITEEILPDGKIYYNIIDRILNTNLKNNYDIINDYAKNIQEDLNKKAGIGLKTIDAEFNRNRVDGIVESVLKKDDYSVMINDLCSSVENFSRAIVDDFIEKNADLHSKAGLKPIIEREMHGGACSFCKPLAGTYDYEEAKILAKTDPKRNPFARHRHCRCTVTYNPMNGKKKETVHSAAKHKALDDKRDRIDLANKIVDNKLSNIAKAKALELGYNPLPDNKVVNTLRKDAEKRIQNLSDDEIKALRKYTYNGVDDDGKRLYYKINGYIEGYYNPINKHEEEIIKKNYKNIYSGLLKNKHDKDIIVYRKDKHPVNLEGISNKFLSGSVTKRGAFEGNPNVAIIVPKGSSGAYVENLSIYPKQREFLLNSGTHLEKIYKDKDIYIYKVVKSNE